MKLHFESDLDYQEAAIRAVCDLFRGQEINRTEFTVTRRFRALPDYIRQSAIDLGHSTSVQGEIGLVENALGGYNPDWAVLINTEEGEKLYFVIETKASTLFGDLRGFEMAKVECGKAHFEALRVGESPAQYQAITSVDELLAGVAGG